MATIDPVVVLTGDDGCQLVQWPHLKTGDVGSGYRHPRKADRTVEVEGVPGGATVSVLGKVSPSSAGFLLSDPLLNDLTIGVADKKGKAIMENVMEIFPSVAGGDGTTDLTVTILFTGGK